MASDPVSICNQALARLGEEQIMSLDDESQAAGYCSTFYEQTRDEVLQSHLWKFATKTVTLSRLSTAPLGPWTVQYQMPTDCLRVIDLNGTRFNDSQDFFAIQENRLLTDETAAVIRYIFRQTDANKFSPLFVEALACKLAHKLAKPLTEDSNTAREMLAEYENVTGPKARRADAFLEYKRPPLPYMTSNLVQSRRGGRI